MNRRHFLAILSGLIPTCVLARLSPAIHPPIDVTGKQTPEKIIKGVLGKTRFSVNASPMYYPPGQKCYFNGADVSNRTSECDTRAGWVRMFDVDANGEFVSNGKSGWLLRSRTYKPGMVRRLMLDDARKGRKSGMSYWWIGDSEFRAVERIHFGKVEVQ